MSESSTDSLWLVIPTSNRHIHLNAIFEASGIPAERRVLIRTTAGEDFLGSVNIYQEDVFNIQSWWNTGIEYAALHGGKYVAVLNDDADFEIGTLQKMLDQMITEDSDLCHPDPIVSQGWGHCWILRIDSNVRPDRRFVWWCGDHDLEFQANRARGVSISPVLVRNLYANVLTSGDKKFESIIKSDIRSFKLKYPAHTLKTFSLRILKKVSISLGSR